MPPQTYAIGGLSDKRIRLRWHGAVPRGSYVLHQPPTIIKKDYRVGWVSAKRQPGGMEMVAASSAYFLMAGRGAVCGQLQKMDMKYAFFDCAHKRTGA